MDVRQHLQPFDDDFIARATPLRGWSADLQAFSADHVSHNAGSRACACRFISQKFGSNVKGSCWLKDVVPNRADWQARDNDGTVSGVLHT